MYADPKEFISDGNDLEQVPILHQHSYKNKPYVGQSTDRTD